MKSKNVKNGGKSERLDSLYRRETITRSDNDMGHHRRNNYHKPSRRIADERGSFGLFDLIKNL